MPFKSTEKQLAVKVVLACLAGRLKYSELTQRRF